MTTMKALVFDAPATDASSTRVADVATPEPGPGQVSIDVAYAGVNFKDVMSRRGDPGYADKWPFIPGAEVAGTVRAVGAGVDTLTVGDRVVAYTGQNGLAEQAVASAELTVRVPSGLPLEKAAAAPIALTTAWLLINEVGRVRTGDVLLVQSAAGGVGRAVATLARLAGASLIIGSVGSPDRVAAARAGGYDEVVVRGPGLAAEVRALTGGRRVNLVLDPQGTALLETNLEVVAAGGRIVLSGNAGGTPLAALPPTGRLFGGNVSIGAFSLAAWAAKDPTRVALALRSVLDHLTAGELDVDVTLMDGLAGAALAQQALAEGRGRGKHVAQLVLADPSQH